MALTVEAKLTQTRRYPQTTPASPPPEGIPARDRHHANIQYSRLDTDVCSPTFFLFASLKQDNMHDENVTERCVCVISYALCILVNADGRLKSTLHFKVLGRIQPSEV